MHLQIQWCSGTRQPSAVAMGCNNIEPKMKTKNILIIGGGNVGHSLAYSLSDKANVNLLVRDKTKWNTKLRFGSSESQSFKVFTWDEKIEDSPSIIFLTLPLLYRKDTLDRLLQLKIHHSTIVAIPGYGNFEELISTIKGYEKFNYGSLQRVPYICRIKEYGKEIEITGYKDKLFLYLKDKKDDLLETFSYLFSTPTYYLESHLQNTLSNSNPLLHTSRLYSIFHNNLKKKRKILFYEEWNDESSHLLINMDSELREIYKANHIENLHTDILSHYGVSSAVELTNKIRNIDAFKKIETPMIQDGEGHYTADLQSRYFTEDFGIGLKCIDDIAIKSNLKLKFIPMILNWYNSIMKEEA
ncbi:NAD/NADP octopine/nopaline dehydrogenase family protein [Providencia rettgeri]|uniref:NAD/NADP octopine/nopaline dehydrogenase family protein n=1 Tax=Providencia sp. PROV035 TaxID=2949766 RepID=UPI00234BA6E7|nr:NAD/NADP octopine/nopaline dehydrogenase family protein [Providencia sp. PROV035]MCL0021036.1 NAD/NADP octopine/nopaline dehydrogenase family protein [Providencia rettgeri]